MAVNTSEERGPQSGTDKEPPAGIVYDEARQKAIARAILPKSIIVFVLLYLSVTIGAFLIRFAAEEISDNLDEAEQVTICDRYYYEKEYGRLRDRLMLYDLFDDTYDIYWEAVDGCGDYQEYLQWKRAQEKGLPGSEEQMELYREKVQSNAQSCKFEKNRPQLEKYAQEVSEE